MAVGVGYRRPAEALGLPLDLTRRELGRDQLRPRLRAVDVIADEHRAADAIREPAREVDLLGRDPAALGLQTDERAPDAEGAAVHVLAAPDGRKILRRPLGRLFVAPEELARFRVHPDDAFRQELHVLFAASPLYDNRRRVARGVAARDRRLPDDRARLFVQRRHRGLRAAGGDYDEVAVNEWGLRVSPLARLSAELCPDVLLPSNLAAAGFEAGEVSVRAERVDEVSVNGRGGAGLRVGRVLVRVADVADAGRPDRLSVPSRDGLDELVLHAAVAHQVDARPDDHRRRVAVPDVVHLPEQPRPPGRPLLEEAALPRHAVARRPAPLGPVGGRSRRAGRARNGHGREAQTKGRSGG